jgi:hypothetical protein
MKLNKTIVGLGIFGTIAGLVLFFLPTILGGIESRTLAVVCLAAGLVLFTFSLGFLDRYVSKRKRPELLRQQKIEAKDERNTIIRDKAGAKTLIYLWWMIMISVGVFSWFDIQLDYLQLIWWIMLVSIAIYFVHIYYYKRRL